MATALIAKKPRRKEVPKDKVLCEYCTAKCCRYFALPIEAPEELADFEFIRWFLLHERATVFKEDEDWYLLVHTSAAICRTTTAAASTTPARKSAATTPPRTANTKTTGRTTSTWSGPSKSPSTPKPCCKKRASSIRSAKPPLLPILL